MRKLMTFLLSLTALVSYAQPKPAYSIFTADGKQTDYGKMLKALQDAGEFTEQLVLQEEYKNYPADEIWAEFCRRNGVEPSEAWFNDVKKYEKEVLFKRG